MIEQTQVTHKLTVEVRDSKGNLKAERYVQDGIEFVPNFIHTWLRRKGYIDSHTYKIPFLLGKKINRG